MAFFMNLLSRPAALKTLKEARALLNDVTPLNTDCGRLCEGECCKSDETGENGMLLFPFEEAFYKEPTDGFEYRLADDDSMYRGGKRLVCSGACPRDLRPLACRIFPLRIRVECDANGENTRAVPELDPRAWCCCPLLEMGGMRAMSAGFIEAVRLAGEALIKNVYMLEALHGEQRLIDEMRRL